MDQLESIFSGLFERNKKDKIRSNINDIKKETIEKWAGSKKIKLRYFWGCVGSGRVAHRVKCLTVPKDKELIIMRADTICGSDNVGMGSSEDFIAKSYILLIHSHMVSDFGVCKKCPSG
jgi:hypothetical protein